MTRHRQAAPSIYTLTDAVAYTGHSIYLLRQHIYHGRTPALIPDTQGGRVLLFTQATLDKWLAAKARQRVTEQGGRPPDPDQFHRAKLRKLSRARLAKLASRRAIDPGTMGRGELINALAVDA